MVQIEEHDCNAESGEGPMLKDKTYGPHVSITRESTAETTAGTDREKPEELPLGEPQTEDVTEAGDLSVDQASQRPVTGIAECNPTAKEEVSKSTPDFTEAATRVVNTSADNPKESASNDDKPEDIDPREHFKNGNYRWAKEGWLRQLKSVSYVFSKVDNDTKPQFDEKKMAEFRDIRFRANLNVALVSLKLKEYGDAVSHADACLKEDHTSAKALYRKAMGQFEQGLVEDAKTTIWLCPANRDPAVEQLRRDIGAALKQRKAVMRGIFKGLAKEEETKTAMQRGSWFLRPTSNGWWLLAGGAVVTIGLAIWLRNSRTSTTSVQQQFQFR